MSCQTGSNSLAKQGKFKVGIVSTARLCILFTTYYFFVIMDVGSLAMSAGANPALLGQMDSPACVNPSSS
jgi:hypothetical protein